MPYYTPPETELDTELGRNLGYEYAQFGLTLPESPLKSFTEGYKAGKHQYSSYTKIDSNARRVIRLRYSAWRRNRSFDPGITATYLKRITVNYCPITREKFTWGLQLDTDASVDRASNNGGYAVGNILYLSVRANKAKGSKSFREILEIYQSKEDTDGLTHAEWCRLLYLSYACDSSIKGAIEEKQDIFPQYLIIPKSLITCNIVCGIQSAITTACIAKSLHNTNAYPIHGKTLQGISSLGSKKVKRLFEEFSHNFSLLVNRNFRLTELKDVEHFEFSVADSWTDQITLLYVKWLEHLVAADVKKILSILMLGKVVAGDLSSWHLDTNGYVK